MKRTMVFAVVCTLLACVVLAGCSSGGGKTKFGSYGEAEYKGSDLTITLDENPSTGYAWTYELEGSSVKAVSDEFVGGDTGAKAGAPGKHKFVFKTEGSGDTTIHFTYARSWEKTSADQKLDAIIAVKGGSVSGMTTQEI